MGKNILFVSVIVLIFTVSIIPVVFAYQPTIEFRQNPIAIEHSEIIYLHVDPNNIPSCTPTCPKITLTSTAFPQGFDLTTSRLGDTNIFTTNFVKFTSGNTNAPNSIKVTVGDTVQAKRAGTTNGTATIIQSAGWLPWPDYWNNGLTDSQKQACTDTDKDGICDSWELGGSNPLKIDYPTHANYPNSVYEYPCDPICPDPNKPDIYVRIAWMKGHKPDPLALANVTNSFKDMGINLHIQVDKDPNLDHFDRIAFTGYSGNPGFPQIKRVHFGNSTFDKAMNTPGYWDNLGWKQKKQVFHFALWGHQTSSVGFTDSTGMAEQGGNDFMVLLGALQDTRVGTTDQQAGTFMHELGHNIDLKHGGGDLVNCKPNYLSVMNYIFQFQDLEPSRQLNYSEKAIGNSTKDYFVKSLLTPSEGFGSYIPPSSEQQWTAYGDGSGNKKSILTGNATVDWTANQDITWIADTVGGLTLCPPGQSIPNGTLKGYNDTAIMFLDFKNNPNNNYWAGGIGTGTEYSPTLIIDDKGKLNSTFSHIKQNGTLTIQNNDKKDHTIYLYNSTGDEPDYKVEIEKNKTGTQSFDKLDGKWFLSIDKELKPDKKGSKNFKYDAIIASGINWCLTPLENQTFSSTVDPNKIWLCPVEEITDDQVIAARLVMINSLGKELKDSFSKDIPKESKVGDDMQSEMRSDVNEKLKTIDNKLEVIRNHILERNGTGVIMELHQLRSMSEDKDSKDNRVSVLFDKALLAHGLANQVDHTKVKTIKDLGRYHAPDKQQKIVEEEDVRCNHGLVLLVDKVQGDAICVKKKTVAKLFERDGWSGYVPLSLE